MLINLGRVLMCEVQRFDCLYGTFALLVNKGNLESQSTVQWVLFTNVDDNPRTIRAFVNNQPLPSKKCEHWLDIGVYFRV